MAENAIIETAERRSRQRFVAKWRGDYCFWVVIEGEREPLVDLSLEGFAVLADSPSRSDQSIAFVLQRSAVPDEIRGLARVVNHLSGPEGGQIGCVFEQLEGDGRERLEDWLTAHVLMNASVPISEKEAAMIVAGPSLI